MTSTPKTTYSESTIAVPGPAHHHHFGVHHGRRLRHILHPSGKKIHIASSPDHAEELRKTQSMGEKDDEFDVVIHGSPEHMEALRETHAHHEQRRESLRQQHGQAYDEFERVHRELDTLATELHMMSDHTVQLDANFSKYGYSAHLRTRDSPNHSSAASLAESEGHEKHVWEDKNSTQFMRFWKKPIVRQYFHKGLMWRASETQEVASYELFVDLFYVGIIEIASERATEDAIGDELLTFVITFIIGWKFWQDLTAYIAWFDADDIVRRLSVLFWLTCLLGFTTNIYNFRGETYTPAIAFFLASRLYAALYYVWMAYLIPMVRPAMIGTAVSFVFPSVIWIGSIHVEEPNRMALIWLAIFFDLFLPPLLVYFERGPSWFGEKVQDWTKSTFEFFPANNIEHKVERTNAFVTLVFGYSVLSILYQSAYAEGINAFFGKAVLGLIIAFTFNWLYFEIDSFNLHVHAFRRHYASAIIWQVAHLPFIMAYVLAASALSKLVLAHDSEDTDYHHLAHSFEAASEDHISDGQRWFFCAGLGVSLAMMNVISLCHSYKNDTNPRLRKNKRLTWRFMVAIILICLPLADNLSSLSIISIATGLLFLVLLLELMGSSCKDSRGGFLREKNRQCKYMASCKMSRKELEANIKDSHIIGIEHIAQKEGTDKTGGYHAV